MDNNLISQPETERSFTDQNNTTQTYINPQQNQNYQEQSNNNNNNIYIQQQNNQNIVVVQGQHQPNQPQANNQEQSSRREKHAFEDEFIYDGSEHNSYMKLRNCLGRCFGSLRVWLPCFCCCIKYPYVTVKQYEFGIKQRFGQFLEIIKPGMHKINPFTESIVKISKKTVVQNIGGQTILTKDNLSVGIDAVVYYRIVDPKKVLYRIKNVSQSIIEITTACMRTICGENTLQQILEERERVSEEIANFLYEHIQDWGVLIEQVFIKDMTLNQDLQVTMSTAAKMKRLGESKVISARADVQSAALFREAADTLDSKAAIQMRYLEMVNSLAQTNNQRIVFIPLDSDEFKEEKDILQLDRKAQQMNNERIYEDLVQKQQEQQKYQLDQQQYEQYQQFVAFQQYQSQMSQQNSSNFQSSTYTQNIELQAKDENQPLNSEKQN